MDNLSTSHQKIDFFQPRLFLIGLSLSIMSFSLLLMNLDLIEQKLLFILICFSGVLTIHFLYNLFNWFDPIVLFTINYITFIGIGVLVIERYNLPISADVLLAISSGFVSLVVGCLIGDYLFSKQSRIIPVRKIVLTNSYMHQKIFWAVIFYFLGILSLIIFYIRIGSIPIFEENAESSRFLVRAGSASLPIFAYSFFLTGTLILISFARTTKSQTFAFSLIIIAALLLFGTGFRSPALKLFLAGFIVLMYIRYNRLPKTALFFVLLFIVVVVGILGIFRRTGEFITNIDMILRIAIFRIFVNNLYVLDLIFGLYPRSEPFMFGQSYLIDFITILPGAQEHFGLWLKSRLGLDFEGGGVTQTIVGEFFLNFGWLGVIFGLKAIGFFLRMIYHILIKSPNVTNDHIVLLTIISIGTMAFVSSGVSLVVIFELIPTVGIYLIYQTICRIRIGLRF